MLCVWVGPAPCVPLKPRVETDRQADLNRNPLRSCALGEFLTLAEGEAVADSLDTCTCDRER